MFRNGRRISISASNRRPRGKGAVANQPRAMTLSLFHWQNKHARDSPREVSLTRVGKERRAEIAGDEDGCGVLDLNGHAGTLWSRSGFVSLSHITCFSWQYNVWVVWRFLITVFFFSIIIYSTGLTGLAIVIRKIIILIEQKDSSFFFTLENFSGDLWAQKDAVKSIWKYCMIVRHTKLEIRGERG